MAGETATPRLAASMYCIIIIVFSVNKDSVLYSPRCTFFYFSSNPNSVQLNRREPGRMSFLTWTGVTMIDKTWAVFVFCSIISFAHEFYYYEVYSQQVRKSQKWGQWYSNRTSQLDCEKAHHQLTCSMTCGDLRRARLGVRRVSYYVCRWNAVFV